MSGIDVALLWVAKACAVTIFGILLISLPMVGVKFLAWAAEWAMQQVAITLGIGVEYRRFLFRMLELAILQKKPVNRWWRLLAKDDGEEPPRGWE